MAAQRLLYRSMNTREQIFGNCNGEKTYIAAMGELLHAPFIFMTKKYVRPMTRNSWD